MTAVRATDPGLRPSGARSMRVPLLRALTLLAALSVAGQANALDPDRALTQYAISTWKTADGLPQNTVAAMAQTSEGHVWFATEEGIARFNGVQFTTFGAETMPALPRMNAQALCASRSGALWIGTYGSGLFRLQGTQVRRWGVGEGLPGDTVTAIVEDGAGVIWVGTTLGLARLDGDRLTSITKQAGLPSGGVGALAPGREGAVWVAIDTAVAIIRNGHVVRIVDDAHLATATVLSLAEGPDGHLWVGTDQGLHEIDGLCKRTLSTRSGLPDDFVRALLWDRKGVLWIGTNGGLSRWRGNRTETLTVRDSLSSALAANLMEDREGSLWVATRTGGVTQLKDADFTSYHRDQTQAADVIDALLGSSRGGLWASGWMGVAHVDGAGRFEDLPSLRSLEGSGVRALFEDGSGRLWVGSWQGVLRAEMGKLEMVPGGRIGNVRALLGDRRGDIWAGLDSGGLVRFRGDEVTRFTTRDGLGGNQVRSFLEDPGGALWIGTYGGLSRYEDGTFTTLTKADGLPSDLIRCLYRDSAGVLWIGTYGGGIARLENGRIASFTSRDGLPTDVAYGILEDDRENLWISSNIGVYRIAKKELAGSAPQGTRRLRSTIYGESDGMASEECNGGSPPAWKTPDGRLWFPTVKGLSVVDPARLREDPPLPVVIESVKVDGRELDPAVPADVPPGARNLEFHFAALSFLAPRRQRFRYKLEGFDEDFNAAGERRGAYYTNVPPGAYRFRVIAESAGNNSETGQRGVEAVFDLRLAPWFYQRRSFLFGSGVAFVLLATGVPLLRVRRLARSERALAASVETRTLELRTVMTQLERANEQLEQLSLTDPLTGIANRRRFEAFLTEEWRRSARHARPLSILMADIDFFKAYNDRYGHQAGDGALCRVAATLHEGAARAEDLVARYGGEEFVIVLSETGEAGAATVAERVRARVEALGLTSEAGIGGVVTISVGYATARPAAREGWAALLGAADRALYEAKKRGRNRVHPDHAGEVSSPPG